MRTDIDSLKSEAERIYEAWNTAWSNDDVNALLNLYAIDAVIESPLIPHLLGKEQGICNTRSEFCKLLEIAVSRKPNNRHYYRKNYFTDGQTLMWEYPRVSPRGEQMDFMEVMELKNGLITHHRVYWGWLGFEILKNNKYYHSTA